MKTLPFLPFVLGFAVMSLPWLGAEPPGYLTISKPAAHKSTLRFPSSPGLRYEVQTSRDLRDWQTVRVGLVGSEAEWLVEDLESGEESMFYRIVVRSPAKETVIVTKTYSSGRAVTELELGEDPRPFNPDATDRVDGFPVEFVDLEVGDGAAEVVDGASFFEGGGGPGVGGLPLPGDVSLFPPPEPWPPEPWPPEPWPPDPEPEPQPGPNLLTAGERNDHQHWGEFQDFLSAYPQHFTSWQLDHRRRVLLAFVDPEHRPLHDVKVTLGNSWFAEGTTAHTHNDGKVALFPSEEIAQHLSEEALSLTIDVGGETYETSFQLTEDDDQEWRLVVPLKKASQARKLDLAWVVDVTGSMADELRFIREELIDIVDQIREAEEIEDVRIATIFYRDRGDQFITRVQDFNHDLSQVQSDIESQRATGGGDFPESVNEALFRAMRELTWREEDTVRLLFLVADAPPHYYAEEQYTYRDAIPDAHASAIKLFPVAGSGIDKSTEYLFRNLAVASMGKYIFITDDSGIGGDHIDPDVAQFKVEPLNEILIRTILEEYRRGL